MKRLYKGRNSKNLIFYSSSDNISVRCTQICEGTGTNVRQFRNSCYVIACRSRLDNASDVAILFAEERYSLPPIGATQLRDEHMGRNLGSGTWGAAKTPNDWSSLRVLRDFVRYIGFLSLLLYLYNQVVSAVITLPDCRSMIYSCSGEPRV